MQTHDKVYIDGAWVPSDGTDAIDVFDSTNGEVIGSIPKGTASDVDKAAKAARAAFPTGPPRPPRSGPSTCTQHRRRPRRPHGRDRHHHHPGGGHGQVAEQIVQVGLPINSLQRRPPSWPRSYAFEETVGNSLIVREPVGVVGCITPWNYPLHQIAAKVAYAMAAGCTVVLKPSEVAPLDAFILAEIIDEVGLPAGVFNLVSGIGPVVGEAIAAHPDVDMVSFTGSTRAGKRVAELGARRRSSASRSSSVASPPTSSSTTSTTTASTRPSRDGVGKAFLNSGQTCSALTRMLVPAGRLGRGRAASPPHAVETSSRSADPFADGVPLGPLVLGRPARPGAAATSRRASTRAPRSSPAAPASPRAWTTTATSSSRPCSPTCART